MRQLQPNSISSEKSCQPFFKNQSNFNPEDQLLADCTKYCVNIVQHDNSPWQRHMNLMAYLNCYGQTKISKLQKRILQYMHRWFFSEGRPVYLKTRNLARKVKSNRSNTSTAITRLVDRGIIIRLEYWSDRYQRFRSVLLPKLQKTHNQKLIFELKKRIIPLHKILEQNHVVEEVTQTPPLETQTPPSGNYSKQNHVVEKVTVAPPSDNPSNNFIQVSVTQTGGCLRYFYKNMKSLKIQNGYIYTNILYNNYQYNCCYYYQSNNILRDHKYLLRRYSGHPKKGVTADPTNKNLVPINLSRAKGANNMQTKLKPKRIVLKTRNHNQLKQSPSIDESISILEKKSFDPNSIPYSSLTDLLYYIENKLFINYDHNDPNIQSPDLNALFRIRVFDQSKVVRQYDTKLFKMLLRTFIDGKNFHDTGIAILSKKLIGYWSNYARKNKNKNKGIKFTNHNPNLKSKTGFKIYTAILYHLHYVLDYNPENGLDFYESRFVKGLNRFFSYSYALSLPKKVSFDTALIDYNDSGRFLKCLTLTEDEFCNFINSNKNAYQVDPDNQRSLNNFKEIFADSFYSKNPVEGKKRFEQFKPRFARFMEVLINRIGKYSNNGKRVELCNLKLTAETKQDMPVLYYYMEWLKSNIFDETIFSFDEMFSLQNWNIFIKSFMRNERGYSDYWKIVDNK